MPRWPHLLDAAPSFLGQLVAMFVSESVSSEPEGYSLGFRLLSCLRVPGDGMLALSSGDICQDYDAWATMRISCYVPLQRPQQHSAHRLQKKILHLMFEVGLPLLVLLALGLRLSHCWREQAQSPRRGPVLRNCR